MDVYSGHWKLEIIICSQSVSHTESKNVSSMSSQKEKYFFYVDCSNKALRVLENHVCVHVTGTAAAPSAERVDTVHGPNQ